jgi:hypothetical protein
MAESGGGLKFDLLLPRLKQQAAEKIGIAY